MQEGHESHIRARIGGAVVSTDPFPYLYVRDVLPAEIYEMMACDTPGTGFCRVLDLFGAVAGLQPGVLFDFRMPEFAPASVRRLARTWEHKYRPYIDLIDHLTIEKLQAEIHSYVQRLTDLGCHTREPPRLGRALFCHRSDGWGIGPYVSGVAQIMENTIYLPLPNSVDEQGTLLHKPKRQIRIPAGQLKDSRSFPRGDVEETDLMPYRANTLVSILNTPFSIRSTEHLPGPNLRYTLSSIVCDIDLPAVPDMLALDDFRP